MGKINKIKKFVDVFQAMSDETRQQILLLLDDGELCVGDLVKQFNLSQPTISKHLSILKNAGLVTNSRKGQKVLYSLNESSMRCCCHDFFTSFNSCIDLFHKRGKHPRESKKAI